MRVSDDAPTAAARAITMVVLTHNRPAFLARLFRYLDANRHPDVTTIAVHISGSLPNIAAYRRQAEERGRRGVNFLFHQDVEFSDKACAAVALVTTPYLMMAADDDFYFVEWITKALNILEEDNTIGSVYGNYIDFRVDTYRESGDRIDFPTIDSPNAFLPYLQDEMPTTRLEELAKTPEFINTGWYSLTRTRQMQDICRNAVSFALKDERIFERYFIFCQAAIDKTVMIEDIFLARQMNRINARKMFGHKSYSAELKVAMAASERFLVDYARCDPAQAADIVRETYANMVDRMRSVDQKRLLRIVADHVPGVRSIQAALRPRSVFSSPNARLPATPSRAMCMPYMELVAAYVRQREP